MQSIKVMAVFGTRPEAIKMCPLVKALQREPRVSCSVCVTGQHREMLRQVMALFGVTADVDLDIMRAGQTLSGVTARVLEGLEKVFAAERPDLVLVHGDTTTSFAASLAAFYAQIPVGHVEAGLRTETIHSPFPEELNRRLTGRIAALHFAPTALAAENLLREGIAQGVFVTGNTVIDALRYTVREDYMFHEKSLSGLPKEGRIALVTAHRRENWGKPLQDICGAVLALADMFPDVTFVFPAHPNPTVRDTVCAVLGGHSRVCITEPLDVMDMHNLMARSYLVLTDSGGLQEEAPALGAPVVVLRTETERPEAIEGGTAILAGVERGAIVDAARGLFDDPALHAAMRGAASPYGDGYASEKIVRHILSHMDR